MAIGIAAVVALLGPGAVTGASASAGSVDQSFGAGGVVQTDLSTLDGAMDVLAQPDGKAITIGFAEHDGVLLRHRTDGTLDPAFGSGGVVRTSPRAQFLKAGVLQADGRIVVVGSTSSLDDVVVARFLPSGAPDASFGSAGFAVTDFGSVDDGNAITLQPDGKLVVAGRSGDALAVARYLPNGTLDPTFGTGGRTTTNLGADTSAEGAAVGVLSTGAIVVGGRGGPSNSGEVSMVLARYTAGGVLDGTFGAGGVVAPAAERLADLTSLVVQPGDRVVVAGATHEEDRLTQTLARYLADGSLDPTFGRGGVTRAPLSALSIAQDLTVDGTGRLVAAGEASNSEEGIESSLFSFVTVSRFSPDGIADATFGCAGSTQIEVTAEEGGRGTGVTVAPDGRILVGGTAFTDPNTNLGRPDFLLVGVLAHGSPAGGYWITRGNGGVSPFGTAGGCGSLRGLALNGPVVGHAARPSGDGYWFVAGDGGVFARGDAPFLGSAGGIPLHRPVVGMAATPSGGGYWLVASDGGIFAFGDARFFGSTGGIRLNRPVVAMAATPSGGGYWLVASDGGIFAFGDAGFFGSTGGIPLHRPVVGMKSTGPGTGYWLAGADGGVFAFGGAPFLGSTGGLPFRAEAVAIT